MLGPCPSEIVLPSIKPVVHRLGLSAMGCNSGTMQSLTESLQACKHECKQAQLQLIIAVFKFNYDSIDLFYNLCFALQSNLYLRMPSMAVTALNTYS